MTLFLSLTLFFLGLIIGSFLNVVIFRFGTHKSLGGRSSCMSCRRTLAWHELIPVFSFLWLKGRCRHCRSRISLQYPIVEFITGIVFLLLFLKFEPFLYSGFFSFATNFLYYALVFSIFIVIAFYDLRHKIIPDKLSLALGVLSFAGLFFFGTSDAFSFAPHFPSLSQFLAGFLVALPFALFWLVSRGAWMGLGDAKLALSIGWLLGISQALSALVLSFWFGALMGIYLVLFRKTHGMKSQIPFAPFLVLGTFLAFIFDLHLFGL